MRNLRKVVALVLAFAMVLSMSAVSFAAEMTAAEKAETIGLLVGEGDGVTAEYLAKTPTRLQAAIISLRLRGLEEEAKAFEGTETFPDVAANPELIPWAEGQAIAAYLYANPDLGWIGDENGNLMPTEPISAQAYVKVMLEALGYMQGVDFEWADVFTFAATVGLDDLDADTMMTNEHLAVGSIEALMATTADGEMLLDELVAAGAIDEDDAIDAGLIEEVMDFAVKSVEPYGLKAIKITFTADIDDDETIDVEVDDDDEDVEEYEVYDNVLIVVLEDVQDQATDLDLLITATGVDGIEVDEEEAEVTMEDKEDPELVSVTVDNAKTFKVKFSEPIDPDSYENGTAVFDDVLLDDAKLVGEATWNDDYTEIKYVLNDAVAANTYVFTMEDVEDFAGFVSPEEEVTVTVIADDDEPQLVEVKVESTTEIVLIFDEDVADIGDVEVDGEESDTEIDGDEVTVTLDPALEASDAFISVDVTWEDVEDVIGNKGDGETTFTAPFDDEAPTVSIEVSSDNELVFIFSEDVDGFDEADLGDIFEIFDDEDDEISIADFFGGNDIMTDETDIDDYEDEDDEDNIYYIDLDADYTNVDETEITIVIDGTNEDDEIIDLSVLANELQEAEFELTLNDLLAPEVDGDVLIIDKDGTDETFRIAFSEEMDEDTLLDDGNYYVGGMPLDEYDFEIDVNGDSTFVDITVEDTDLDGMKLEFFGLEDLAENSLTVNGLDAITLEDADASFDGVTFELVALDEIEVTYDDGSFIVADPDEFLLLDKDGDEFTDIYVTNAVVDADDDNVLILTLSEDLTAFGENGDVTTDNALELFIEVDGDETVNAFDIPLVQGMTDVVDGVEATAEIELNEDIENLLVIDFDELVYFAAGTDVDDIMTIYNEDEDEYEDSTTGLVFDYWVGDVNGIDPADGFEKISVELTADDEYTVELFSRYLEDLAGNVAGGVDEETYLPK